MRISRVLSAAGWKRAVGEVALIVIGISIALGADAWWQDRQERDEERALIGQILLTLRSDREGLLELTDDIAERAELLSALRAHMTAGHTFADSLVPNLAALRYWQTSQINRAPYEDLKARGLDLVQDQATRLMLIEYFDRDVPRLEDYDRIDRQQTMDYSTTVLQRHLTWDDAGYRPVDASTMWSDPEFRYMVGHKAGVVRGRAGLYRDFLAQTDTILAHLDAVLAP